MSILLHLRISQNQSIKLNYNKIICIELTPIKINLSLR